MDEMENPNTASDWEDKLSELIRKKREEIDLLKKIQEGVERGVEVSFHHAGLISEEVYGNEGETNQ